MNKKSIEYDFEFSVTFKRKMNRLFREEIGTDHIPHPEVDNSYERIRSRIVRCLLLIKKRIK